MRSRLVIVALVVGAVFAFYDPWADVEVACPEMYGAGSSGFALSATRICPGRSLGLDSYPEFWFVSTHKGLRLGARMRTKQDLWPLIPRELLE